ncbi:MAG: hypothetical protein QOG38_1025 [Hyphomicrobiales bacterium]|jgi:hypothetical protein|nr:hypothetical protein [Hyphomicrobiales bacterium]
MKQSCHELTLTNVLADPMVRTVMAADRVDPQELAAMLAAVAQTLKPSSQRLPERVAQFICTN